MGDLFCMGCSLRHIFFAVCWKCADEGACSVRFHAGRRGHMKLHTTLSAELNATALLFKKPFHLHLVFHNACSNELCEFMSADRGVLSIYCRATVLLQRGRSGGMTFIPCDDFQRFLFWRIGCVVPSSSEAYFSFFLRFRRCRRTADATKNH